MSRALVLTYHAIEDGPPPLCIEPTLFAQHLTVLADAGATLMTVSALAAALRRGDLPERTVALTFDDGYASVGASHDFRATVFCVAGRLGGWNDWPSQPSSTPRLRLADAEQLRGLAASGWEIGAHGLDHDVLRDGSELASSRAALEEATGVTVRSFAFPYGVVPPDARPELARAGYIAACTTRLAPVSHETDPLALPRVDAHYVRRPSVLRAVIAGRFDVYLRARAGGAWIRRLARKDYARA